MLLPRASHSRHAATSIVTNKIIEWENQQGGGVAMMTRGRKMRNKIAFLFLLFAFVCVIEVVVVAGVLAVAVNVLHVVALVLLLLVVKGCEMGVVRGELKWVHLLPQWVFSQEVVKHILM